MNKKINVSESDCFAIPLENDKYIIGVAARVSKNRGVKTVLGYFFADKLLSIPGVKDILHLNPDNALLKIMFSSMYITNGKWPIIGQIPNWCAKTWSVPIFVRQDAVTLEYAMLVNYANDQIDKVISEEPCLYQEHKHLPKDGLYGAAGVEMLLQHLLDGGEVSDLKHVNS